MSELTTKAKTASSDVVDGAAAAVFLKNDVVLDSFSKRAGLFLVYGAGAIGLHSRFIQKPALKAALSDDQYKAVVAETMLGSVTLGK